MQRSVWRHLAVLICIALLISVTQHASSFHDRAPDLSWGTILWFALLASPGRFASLLVVAPAIAVGIGYLGRRGMRSAFGVVTVTLLVLIAIDVWIDPAAGREIDRLARLVPSKWPVPGETAPSPVAPMDSIGVLRTAAYLIVEQPREIGERLARYPAGHPRVVAAVTVQNAATFLLPLILAGIVVGASAWVRERVIFRSTRDEVVARWFLAWVLAFAAWRVIGSWSSGYSYEMLFRDGSLWLPLVPYAPFVILGALGWHAAWRNDESVDSGWSEASAGSVAKPATPVV